MKRWVGFIAVRYISRGRKNSPSPLFSMLGIAVGVLALTVIMAVMNGFQLGFIESILEISSGHLRLNTRSIENEEEFNEGLRSLPGIVSVLPFEELSVLLRGRPSSPRGALVRGVPANAFELDPGLASRLIIEQGYFDLSEPNNIVLGAELARILSVGPGDTVNFLSLTGGIRIDEADSNDRFTVTGIFRSFFHEYDLGWAFINLETASQMIEPLELRAPGETPAPQMTGPNLGIKLNNRWHDQRAMAEIRRFLTQSGLSETDFRLESWRDYNRAFFGALRTEKLVMFILVGLIFIVVGLNIYQAQRRIVLEKREEIGLLRALGASDKELRLVFVLDGFIIGLSGVTFGLIPGLLISFNIQAFFTFLERVVNLFIFILNITVDFLGGSIWANEFSIFSPQIFYVKEIIARVIPHEVVLISLFGFLAAILAAWFASGKVSGANPAEVLRYE